MRIGVVGLGYWGSKHARVLSGLSEVSQVVGVDQREDRRTAMEHAFPSMITLPTLDDALDRVDGLVIATAPQTHVTLAAQAIEAGKHVLVEKPLALCTADGTRLIDLADRHSCVLMTGHTFEYNAAVHALRDLVQSGELGEILYADAARVNLGLYQQDCNVMWDLAPHDISILNEVLGATPTSVAAWGTDHVHPGLVDNAYLRMDYGVGAAKATVHVSWLNPRKIRQITVVGSAKMAVYDDLADEHRLQVYDKGLETIPDLTENPVAPMSYRYGDIVSPYIDFVEPLRMEDAHFVECIGTGATPVSNGRKGLDVVRVLEAADQSLVTGQPVPLSVIDLRSRVAAR